MRRVLWPFGKQLVKRLVLPEHVCEPQGKESAFRRHRAAGMNTDAQDAMSDSSFVRLAAIVRS